VPKTPGRKPGLYIHTEAFEALLAAGHHLRKAIAAECEVTPQFLSDLCAHRGGASRPTAERLARSLNVPVAAIFPEVAEHAWVSPLPDRSGKRDANKSRGAAA
jgi:hypothetical protein